MKYNGQNLIDVLEAHKKGDKADLSGADLRGADLRGANLAEADLREAYLIVADLRGANLIGADNIPYIPLACPSCGSFIGWKKAGIEYIVKLLIPEDAARSSATTNKCRCNKAKVLEIQTMSGDDAEIDRVSSSFDPSFIYKVGETVTSEFDPDRWNECSKGIHFFINRQDAVNY